MSLLEDMNSLDQKNAADSKLGSMFKKDSPAAPVKVKTQVKPAIQSDTRRGAPSYADNTERKMVQVTTRLTEDNYKWAEEFAKSKGLGRAGLISYTLNYLIDKERGITPKN